ncbi:hypothetical protein NXH64_12035 [Butyrivibrio fibrisolvens]|uniref:InlB B-repeat-containing protein n=1 Tax=Pseudobutyrivibrio ruminis TaxID=46206 RepID=UPI00040AF803|nr:hypothetical protein [Pseudobutyrivibrio ruminis]MDC7280223.1 hypothetical protein [Butyrivibrio fibrisolvens]
MKEIKVKRIVSIILILFLIVTGLNFNTIADELRGSSGRIVAFEEIPDSIRLQEFTVGASVEEIVFPSTLTVTVEKEVKKETLIPKEKTEEPVQEEEPVEDPVAPPEDTSTPEPNPETTPEEPTPEEPAPEVTPTPEPDSGEPIPDAPNPEPDPNPETPAPEEPTPEEPSPETPAPEPAPEVSAPAPEPAPVPVEAPVAEPVSEPTDNPSAEPDLVGLLFPAIIAHAEELDTPEETPAETTDQPVEAPAAEPEIEYETVVETVTNRETVVFENVSWKIDSARSTFGKFDFSVESNYVLMPEISWLYDVAANLPTIEVRVLPAENRPAFTQSTIIDGVKITVSADEGVFPEGVRLIAHKITGEEEAQVEELVDAQTSEHKNVASSYTFDISIVDAAGNEVQPDTSRGNVTVSFETDEIGNSKLETEVYHIDDNNQVDELAIVEENNSTISVETDGFSMYMLIFTSNANVWNIYNRDSFDITEVAETLGVAASDSFSCGVQVDNTDDLGKVTLGTPYLSDGKDHCIITIQDEFVVGDTVELTINYDVESDNPEVAGIEQVTINITLQDFDGRYTFTAEAGIIPDSNGQANGTVTIIDGNEDGRYSEGETIKLKFVPNTDCDFIFITINDFNQDCNASVTKFLSDDVTYVKTENAYYYNYIMPAEDVILRGLFIEDFYRLNSSRVYIVDAETEDYLGRDPCVGDELKTIITASATIYDSPILYYRWVDATQLAELLALGFDGDFDKTDYYLYDVNDGIYTVQPEDIGKQLYLVAVQAFGELNHYAVKAVDGLVTTHDWNIQKVDDVTVKASCDKEECYLYGKNAKLVCDDKAYNGTAVSAELVKENGFPSATEGNYSIGDYRYYSADSDQVLASAPSEIGNYIVKVTITTASEEIELAKEFSIVDFKVTLSAKAIEEEQTLTAKVVGTTGTYIFYWYRDDEVFATNTVADSEDKYVLTTDDIGHRFKVKATQSKPDKEAETDYTDVVIGKRRTVSYSQTAVNVTITPAKGSIRTNDTVTFKLEAKPGYTLNSFTLQDGSKNDIPYTTNNETGEYSFVQPAKTVYLKFDTTIIYYNISKNVTGHGTISHSKEPGNTSKVNMEIDITVTPDEGYYLKKIWISEDAAYVYYRPRINGRINVANRYFKMPAQDVTIYAEFDEIIPLSNDNLHIKYYYGTNPFVAPSIDDLLEAYTEAIPGYNSGFISYAWYLEDDLDNPISERAYLDKIEEEYLGKRIVVKAIQTYGDVEYSATITTEPVGKRAGTYIYSADAITYDYLGETASVAADGIYELATSNEATTGSATISLTETLARNDTYYKYIYIRTKETATDLPSKWVSVQLDIPRAPQVYEWDAGTLKRYGAIIRTSTDMEYKLKDADDSEYTDALYDITPVLKGHYVVRYKATSNSFASYTDSVIVGETTNTVSLTGTEEDGNELSASIGELIYGTEPLKYKWYRDDEEIQGATSDTYLLTGEDIDKYIYVEVTNEATDKSARTRSVNRIHAGHHTVIVENGYGGESYSISPDVSKIRTKNRVVLTLTPQAGYKPKTVVAKDAKGRDVNLVKISGNTYCFREPDSDVTVTVTYEESTTFILDVHAGINPEDGQTHGTAEITPETKKDYYNAGDIVKIKIDPADKYEFICFASNDISDDFDVIWLDYIIEISDSWSEKDGVYYYEYTMPAEDMVLVAYFYDEYTRLKKSMAKIYRADTGEVLDSAPQVGDVLTVSDKLKNLQLSGYAWLYADDLHPDGTITLEEVNEKLLAANQDYTITDNDDGKSIVLYVIQLLPVRENAFDTISYISEGTIPVGTIVPTVTPTPEADSGSSDSGKPNPGTPSPSPSATPSVIPGEDETDDKDKDNKDKTGEDKKNPINKVVDALLNNDEESEETISDEELFNPDIMQVVDVSTSSEPVTVESNKPVTLKYGSGAIEVAMANTSQGGGAYGTGALNAGLADAKAAVEAILSDELLAMVENGSKVKIKVQTTALSEDSITDDEKDIIAAEFRNLKATMPNLKQAESIDISLLVKFDHDNWDAITTTRKPIEITVGISDEDKGKSEKFYILRVHEGETTLLEDLDEDDETITIGSDRFSTYTILYEDNAAKAAVVNSNNSRPFKGIMGWIVAGIALLLVFLRDRLSLQAKRRESVKKARNHKTLM